MNNPYINNPYIIKYANPLSAIARSVKNTAKLADKTRRGEVPVDKALSLLGRRTVGVKPTETFVGN